MLPHHYSNMGHLLAWPAELEKLEYQGVVAKWENGAFVSSDWGSGTMDFESVVLSNSKLGQILIHAQRARYLVAIHESGQ